MRIKGTIKTRDGEKSYLITDRIRKGTHRLILEGLRIKVQDYPAILKAENIKIARAKIELVKNWFDTKTFINEADHFLIE